MVSAPNIENVPRFTQMLHQCESLKESICGKSLEVTSILMEEFVLRQNLETLYKNILLSDVQFALDNKIELELWNNAFKGHIDNFRIYIKEKKNYTEKNEIQAKLFMFLDASIGFYFQLLQEFCDKYDVDLPYHGKPRELGILSNSKNIIKDKRPKLESCLYICQDCLVHLGDLARYRNETQQAYAFYLLAGKILPCNGQPYNQLAILASTRNDLLFAVFYYCKSISVPNPFPAAASNLQKTFAQVSAKYSCNILSNSCVLSVDEFLGLFISISGCTYLLQDLCKLNILKNKVLKDLSQILLDLKTQQLILITGICIFNLQKSRYTNNMLEFIFEDETNVWNFVLSFSVSILQLFVVNTVDALKNSDWLPDDLKCLPGIKIFTDWIVCNTFSLLGGGQFRGNIDLLHQFALLGNILQKTFPYRDKSLSPLAEDWELHGVKALQKVHRRYDFRIQTLDFSDNKICNIRVTRILKFLDWLTKQKQLANIFCKIGSESSMEYVCALPGKQDMRCKSPFSEKSTSLFHKGSGNCGKNEILTVQGPVASYSLFDSMWKSTLDSGPSKSCSGSVCMLTNTASPNVSQIHENENPLGIPMSSKDHVLKQKHSHGKLTVMEEIQSTKSNFKVSKSVLNIDTPVFPRSIAESPHKLHSSSPLPLSPSDGSSNMQDLPDQSNSKGISILSNEDIAPIPIGNHCLNVSPIQNQLLQSSFQNQPLNLLSQQQHHQHLQQEQKQRHHEILIAKNLFISNSLEGSNRISDNRYRSTVSSSEGIDSVQPISPRSNQFTTHPPGIIGQNIRATSSVLQRPFMPSQLGVVTPVSGNLIPTEAQQSWLNTTERLTVPSNIVVENRSIWSSNYAISQGELSPLEQLLQEQRRHQRPK